jgi:SAM-dependent methyltransferase
MTDTPRAKEIAYWDGPGGAHWVRRQEVWDRALAPVSAALLARAAVAAGERVVDVGCGCGDTTLALARLVGAGGRVLGIDVSQAMLARAGARLPPGAPVELVLADATTYAFPRAYDLLFSRLGVMFFDASARAFANLRSALRPGGRVAFCCFVPAAENAWAMVPLRAAYAHVPPLPRPGPEDPGPFSFGDAARVRRILGEAGFAAIGLDRLEVEIDLGAGGGLEAAVESAIEVGPTSRALEGQPPAVRDAVAADLRTVLAAHQRGAAVPLAAALWIVTATSA